MKRTTILRAFAVMTVLATVGVMPKDADAQCAVSYTDIYTDGTSVYAWNSVSDTYNQSGCNPGWSDFTHSYSVSVGVQSPSGRTANSSDWSSAYGGGGYADSSTSLQILGETGEFVATSTEEILCTIAGLVFYAAVSQNVTSCNDERTNIIQQYVTYTVNLAPACEEFTQNRRSVYFGFGEINTGDFSWALVRDPFIAAASSSYGMDKWREEYGSARNITPHGGYRNPANNQAHGGAAQSRHMYGDAADLDVVSNADPEWTDLRDAANRSNPDFVEPVNGPCGLGCVHADWRNHAGDYQ